MPSKKQKAAEAAERSRRAFLLTLAGLGAVGAAGVGAASWLFQREPRLPTVAIMPRESWGAVPADIDGSGEGRYDPITNPAGYMIYDRPLTVALKDLIVHHTATGFDSTPADIQRLHMQDRGYADVAYHYMIGADGTIYEGRVIGARGAHTGGHNTGSIGVSLFGNFEIVTPTTAQLLSQSASPQVDGVRGWSQPECESGTEHVPVHTAPSAVPNDDSRRSVAITSRWSRLCTWLPAHRMAALRSLARANGSSTRTSTSFEAFTGWPSAE